MALSRPVSDEGDQTDDGDERERLPAPSPNRRRTIATLAVAGVLGAGVWILIGQLASVSSLLRALHHAHPWWLIGSVAAAALGYLGYAVLYRTLVQVAAGPRPSLGVTLRLTIAVFGASVIATSAGRLGSEYWSLRRMGERPSRAWSRVLAINIAAWAVLAALAGVASIVLLTTGNRRVPLDLELCWLVVLPLAWLPSAYLSSPTRSALRRPQGGRLRRALASVLTGLVLLRHGLRQRPSSTGVLTGGLLYWGGDLLVTWTALRGFGVHLGFGQLVIGYATGYVSTMLPLPAGGAGGVDAASTYALALVGVPLGPALLATLVQRVCTYWLPLAVALGAARSLKRLPQDLAAAARTRYHDRAHRVPRELMT